MIEHCKTIDYGVIVLQVTEDSLSKSSEMQGRLTEAYEGHQELAKKLQASEEEKKKMKYEVQCLQMKVNERMIGEQRGKWDGGRKRERREREGEREREGGREMIQSYVLATHSSVTVLVLA